MFVVFGRAMCGGSFGWVRTGTGEVKVLFAGVGRRFWVSVVGFGVLVT